MLIWFAQLALPRIRAGNAGLKVNLVQKQCKHEGVRVGDDEQRLMMREDF